MCQCLYNVVKTALCCCSGTCLAVLILVINFGSRNEISLDISSSEWSVCQEEDAEELNAEGIVVSRRSLLFRKTPLYSKIPVTKDW